MKAIVSRLVAAFVLAVVGLTAVAHAQGPGGPGGDPLNLTPDQQKKIVAIQKKYEPDAMKLKAKYQPQIEAIQKKYQKQAEALMKDKSPAGQKKLQALSVAAKKEVNPVAQKAMKESAPFQARVFKEIEGVLDAKQKKVFQQIMAQQKASAAAALTP